MNGRNHSLSAHVQVDVTSLPSLGALAALLALDPDDPDDPADTDDLDVLRRLLARRAAVVTTAGREAVVLPPDLRVVRPGGRAPSTEDGHPPLTT